MDCAGMTALWLRCSTTLAKAFLTVLLFFTVKPKRRHVSAVQICFALLGYQKMRCTQYGIDVG
jgi:hypothetical protein